MSGSSDVRARILCEAIRLFGSKGFSATSVREVVAAAGVTKPTLYYYFANKDALFSEAVNAQLQGLRSLIDGVLDGEGLVLDRLERFLQIYVLGALQNPESVRLIMTATAPTDTSQPRLRTIDRFREELLRLEGAFIEGIESGEFRADTDVASAIMLLLGGADILMMSGLAGHEVPPDFARRLLNTLIHGIAP